MDMDKEPQMQGQEKIKEMDEHSKSSNPGNNEGKLSCGTFYPAFHNKAKVMDSEIMASLGIPIVPFEPGRQDDIGKRVPRAVLNAREDFFLQKTQSWWNLFPVILRNVVEDGGTVSGFEVFKDEGTRTLIVGGSGSGKSTIAASYIIDASHFGTVVATDDSGDLLWKVLCILPSEEWNRIILIRSGSREGESSVGTLNLLHPAKLNVTEHTIAPFITGLINVQRSVLYEDSLFGTKIQQYFGNALRVMFRSGNRTNLQDVYRMLFRPDLGLQMLYGMGSSGQKDQILEDMEFILRGAVSGRIDLSSAYRYVAQLTQSSDLTRFFCDRDPCFDYQALLHPDARYIVILYVPTSSMQKQNSYQAISGFVSYIYGLKESLSQAPHVDNRGNSIDYRSSRLFFVLDEFQNYLNDDIDRIITQGRKMNVSSLLLTQNVRKLVGKDGRNWYPPMKDNFNNILVSGITDLEDLRMFGLERKASQYDLSRVNGVRGRFYWIDHNPPVVSTLYRIAEMDPNALSDAINLLTDHYKFLESKYGIGITRDLWDGSEAFSELEASSSVDEEFAMTSLLYAVFILTHGSQGRVVRRDILGTVEELSRNAPVIGGETGYLLFPRMDQKFAIRKIEDLVRNGYVFRKSVNTGTVYSITREGEKYLMDSLGSGASGGGTEHRMTILETAQKFYFHGEVSKEGEAVYPYVTTLGYPLRPVPDMILSFRTSPRMISLFKGLEKCAVEVQISKQSISAFREKFSIIRSGLGMLILCGESDVDYYRSMINKLYPEYRDQEIAGKGNGNPLDYVYVQRIVEGALDIAIEPYSDDNREKHEPPGTWTESKDSKPFPSAVKVPPPQDTERTEPSAGTGQPAFHDKLRDMMKTANWRGTNSGNDLARMFCRLDSALSRADPKERKLLALPLLRFTEEEFSINERDARVLVNVYLTIYTSEFFSSGSERFFRKSVSPRDMEPWMKSVEKYSEGYSIVKAHLIVELPTCEGYYGKEWPQPVMGLYDDEGETRIKREKHQKFTESELNKEAGTSGHESRITIDRETDHSVQLKRETEIGVSSIEITTKNADSPVTNCEGCVHLAIPKEYLDYSSLFPTEGLGESGNQKGSFSGLRVVEEDNSSLTRRENFSLALKGVLYAQFSALRYLNPRCDFLKSRVPLLAGLSLVRRMLRSMRFSGTEVSTFTDQIFRELSVDNFERSSLGIVLQGDLSLENGEEVGEVIPVDQKKLASLIGLVMTREEVEKALEPGKQVFLQSYSGLYKSVDGKREEVRVQDVFSTLES